MRTLVILVVLLVSPLVHAQASPGFITMDRPDDVSRFGLQVGFVEPDGDDAILALRFDLHGQYILPGRSIGLYGHLPISYLAVDDVEDEAAVQNLELGGFFLLGAADRFVVLRAGLSLPTASDDLADFITNGASIYERLVDLPGILPDTTWLRLSASPILRQGNLILRGDLGLDVLLNSEQDVEGDPLLHLNFGLGIMGGSLAFLVESVNVGRVDDEGSDERFAHTLSLGLRTLGTGQFHFAFILPLDEAVRGDVWIFSVGFDGVL